MSLNALFKVTKINKKHQNHTFTNHGVIWKILKLIKIRDLGMEFDIFVLRFKICTYGAGFNFRVSFLCFFEIRVFGTRFVEWLFEIRLKSILGILILGFKV